MDGIRIASVFRGNNTPSNLLLKFRNSHSHNIGVYQELFESKFVFSSLGPWGLSTLFMSHGPHADYDAL
jgi:hypothetical protein